MSNPSIKIYPLGNYTCGNGGFNEDNKADKPIVDKITKLRQDFEKGGARSVRAIILVHMYNHPHVLLLEKPDRTTIIPGGKLTTGEDDETGLQRLLIKKMNLVGVDKKYEINELLASWYRPQFTEHMYPYCPVHITTPKETERWYLVLLPDKGSLAIPPKYALRAVPFYELQDGATRFGKLLPTIPLLLSRFNITPVEEKK